MENASNYDSIWEKVLEIIRDNTTEVSYNTWFKEPLGINRIDEDLNIVYLQVNSAKKVDFDFIINIIKNRYMQYLQMAFKTVMGEDYKIVLKKIDEYEKPVDNFEDKKKLRKKKKKIRQKLILELSSRSKNYSIQNLILIIS